MNSQTLSIIALIMLLILDLVTIAARLGLRSSSLARLLQVRDQSKKNIEHTLALVNSAPKPFAGLMYTQSLARFLGIGLLILTVIQDSWSTLTILVILILSGLLIAWIEWAAGYLVLRDPERWAIRLTPFIRITTIIFYPLILTSLWLSKENGTSHDTAGAFSEDELKILVEAGQQEGFLEQEEGQMIFSVFQLGDTLTREIMVPRIEMLALDIDTPLPIAIDTLIKSGFSRAPVYKERIDNVIGVLYAKDLLKVWREGNEPEDTVRALLRQPYFVPEAKKVDELLAEMQSLRVHMAVVVDEYGGVAGVVTLEDIIEEIFGEIQDEYDEEELPYQLIDGGDYVFRGRIDLDDFNEIMESNLPREEADTLSGFIYGRLGHVPVTGESVPIDGLNLIVEQVSNRRIRKVRAHRIELSEGQHVDK